MSMPKIRSDINTIQSNLAQNLQQLNTNGLAITENANAILATASGSPSNQYATIALLTSAIPSGNTKAYLTSDGQWCSWNGTAWVAKGLWLSGGTTLGSIPINNLISAYPLILPWDSNFTLDDHTMYTAGTKTITFTGAEIWSDTNGRNRSTSAASIQAIPDGYMLIINFGVTGSASLVIVHISAYVSTPDKFVLFMNYEGRLMSPVAIYQLQLDKFYNPVLLSLSYAGVLVVSKSGNGDYTTINGAISNAHDTPTNPVTIKVMPGIYKEVVNVLGNRNISIIGVNKYTCIIQNDDGIYLNTPLRIEGNAYIANLTIISTHDADMVTAVDSLRAYAIHCDDAGVGTTEINNCILISYQNCALGIGLHQDQFVKVINCELISHTPSASTMTLNGALFCHSCQVAGTTNQNLIVKGCTMKTDLSYATYIGDAGAGAGMVATFYNNIFWSNELGKTNIVRTDTKTTGNLTGAINLTPDSYGNNISNFNVV